MQDRSSFFALAAFGLSLSLFESTSAAQPMAKAQVGNVIRNVENGVDEFRNYLERRGDSASSARSTAQAHGGRRAGRNASEAQKATAAARKDELDDALGDLNRSTNRLRRKFDATDTWMETKVLVERMMDDGRKINQAVVRGSYGSEVARLWATLRTRMNDLARVYGVPPMAL